MSDYETHYMESERALRKAEAEVERLKAALMAAEATWRQRCEEAEVEVDRLRRFVCDLCRNAPKVKERNYCIECEPCERIPIEEALDNARNERDRLRAALREVDRIERGIVEAGHTLDDLVPKDDERLCRAAYDLLKGLGKIERITRAALAKGEP